MNVFIRRRDFLARIGKGLAAAGGVAFVGCPRPGHRVHIIGSGVTGLCVGALLVKQGFHVHVLEAQADLLGGHMAALDRDGFRFSLGPQYVWNFRDGAIGARVLEALGIRDEVPFDSMAPEGFEEIRVGDDAVLDIPMGIEAFEDSMLTVFPDHTRALRFFFSYLRDLHEGARLVERFGLYRFGGPAILTAVALSPDLDDEVKRRIAQCSGWSLGRLLDFCGVPDQARRVLYAVGGLLLENETAVSCMAYAAVVGFLHAGADFPRLGFERLTEALTGCIVANGGSVETGKRVTRLVHDGRRIARVECADGSVYPTDRVISTVSPRVTQRMLGEIPRWRFAYEPSNAVVSAFIGVRDYPGLQERFGGKNIWWQDGLGPAEFEAPDITRVPRFIAVTSESARGTINRNSNESDHSITVLAPGNFAQAFGAFQQSPAAHDELRQIVATEMLKQLESKVLPGVTSYVRFLSVETPLDVRTRMGNEAGNAYGRRLTADSLLRRPAIQCCLNNLHVACATTGTAGIPTAFRTAAILAEALTGAEI